MAGPITLPIADVRIATPRSRIVRIGAPGTTFPFAAGQAVLVGAHGQDLRRPYSIASAPEDTARDGHIELLVGVGPSGLPGAHLDPLEPGRLVDVDGPLGKFQLAPAHHEQHLLFIAGGTGIAPLRSMMRHALSIRPETTTATPSIGLIYSARTSDDFAYAGEFEGLAREGIISLMLTVTRHEDASPWPGSRGRITMTHLREMVHPETLCFVCGPMALVADMPPLLREVGVPAERIRVEEW